MAVRGSESPNCLQVFYPCPCFAQFDCTPDKKKFSSISLIKISKERFLYFKIVCLSGLEEEGWMRGSGKLSKDAPRNTPERTGVLIRPPFNVLTNHCHPPKVQLQQSYNLRLVTLISSPPCLRHQRLRQNSTQLVWWEARCMRWILAPAAGQGTNPVVLSCLLFARKSLICL